MSILTQATYAGRTETKQLFARVRDNQRQYRLCAMQLCDAREEETNILEKMCAATGSNNIEVHIELKKDLERIIRAIKDIKTAFMSSMQMSNTLIAEMHKQVDRNLELAGSASASLH